MKLFIIFSLLFSVKSYAAMSISDTKVKNTLTYLNTCASPCMALTGGNKVVCDIEYAKEKGKLIKTLVKSYLSGIKSTEFSKVDASKLLMATKAKLDMLKIAYKMDATQAELDILLDAL